MNEDICTDTDQVLRERERREKARSRGQQSIGTQ